MNEIDNYINSFMGETKNRLIIMRDFIRELAPQASERLCYRMPTWDFNGKWLVHFAGYEKHIGFYPQPDGIIAFQEKLKEYMTSKGAIQLPLNKPLPIDLIREIVIFRVKEQTQNGVK